MAKKTNVAKLAADIAARGGHINGAGDLVTPMEGRQTMTGFDGQILRATLSPEMKVHIDYLLDKREALENVKNAVENAMADVEQQMKLERLTAVTSLDKHNKKFIISLKPGKTKLEVKEAKWPAALRCQPSRAGRPSTGCPRARGKRPAAASSP